MSGFTLYENYVSTILCSFNRDELLQSSLAMEQFIQSSFETTESHGFNPEVPKTTPIFTKYNLLMYPLPGFHTLYQTICYVFHELAQTEEPHYIQCWLNVFRTGGFITWHSHFPPQARSWHGFLCVDCEPSKTTYRLPGGSMVDIESKNNLLVMSRSDGDSHRTWPWEDPNRPRITIAFDIVPAASLDVFTPQNHWIPI